MTISNNPNLPRQSYFSYSNNVDQTGYIHSARRVERISAPGQTPLTLSSVLLAALEQMNTENERSLASNSLRRGSNTAPVDESPMRSVSFRPQLQSPLSDNEFTELPVSISSPGERPRNDNLILVKKTLNERAIHIDVVTKHFPEYDLFDPILFTTVSDKVVFIHSSNDTNGNPIVRAYSLESFESMIVTATASLSGYICDPFSKAKITESKIISLTRENKLIYVKDNMFINKSTDNISEA
jgi:hypothetical protein